MDLVLEPKQVHLKASACACVCVCVCVGLRCDRGSVIPEDLELLNIPFNGIFSVVKQLKYSL